MAQSKSVAKCPALLTIRFYPTLLLLHWNHRRDSHKSDSSLTEAFDGAEDGGDANARMGDAHSTIKVLPHAPRMAKPNETQR